MVDLVKKVLDTAIKTIQLGAGATVITTGYNTGFGSKLKPSSNSGDSNNSNTPDNKSNNSSGNDNKSNNSSGNDNKSNK
jgi:hypothetical protein